MWNCNIKETNRRYILIKRTKEKKIKKVKTRKAFAVSVVVAISSLVRTLTQIITSCYVNQKM